MHRHWNGSIGLFNALILAFGLLGGFQYLRSQTVERQEFRWYPFSLFVGTVLVALIDHKGGHIESFTNLRGVYVALGILRMGGGARFLI